VSRILEVSTKDKRVVKFEVSDSGSVGPEQVGLHTRTVKSDFDIDQALNSVTPAARAAIDAFRTLQPDDLTVQFGVRVDAQAGGIIGKVGAAGHITVTAHWGKSDE
jgi:Trypsin-co-occurring domain 1